MGFLPKNKLTGTIIINTIKCLFGNYCLCKCFLKSKNSVLYGFLHHFSQYPIVVFIPPIPPLMFNSSGIYYNIQVLCYVPKGLVIKFLAVVSEDGSWSPEIHNPVLEVDAKDLRTPLIRILTPTLYLLPWLIRCSTPLPLISLLSMTTLLLPFDPNENLTMSLGSVLLYLLHIS